LISKPVAFVYQPQGNSPSGRSVTPAWLAEAAEVLQGTIPIIELAQLPLLYDQPLSLGRELPDQVAHIRSYNFFFGADLRIGVVGGSADLLNAMWMRLTYSSRFVSRLLQATLAYLLTDKDAKTQSAGFVREVRRRHRLLHEALVGQGLSVESSAGPSMWLAVPDEHSVCTRLSHAGIVVHPGRFFLPEGAREQRVHICSSNLPSGFEGVAAQIAEACQVPPSWG
jgi:DNA-binding transcriptional MocR family regulator